MKGQVGTVFGQLANRGVYPGEGREHANVLTASTAYKRNAKESAKESSGAGERRWRWRNFCGRANFWASMKLLPNRLQAIFTRVACLWSCVSGRHQLVSLFPLLLVAVVVLVVVRYFGLRFSLISLALFFFFFSSFWPVNETEICFVSPVHTANGDLSRLPRGSFVSFVAQRRGEWERERQQHVVAKWQVATGNVGILKQLKLLK